MVIGELVPKNFASPCRWETAKVVVPFQAAFTAIFKPIVAAAQQHRQRDPGASAWSQEELSGARTAEELGSLVRRSATEGRWTRTPPAVRPDAGFGAHAAEDVMTPRPRVASGDRTAGRDVLATSQRTGFSRFPVVGEDLDDIVGVVHVKQAIAVPRETGRSPVPRC